MEVLKGSGNGDGGVEHGELLMRLIEAMSRPADHDLAAVRNEAEAAMGQEVFVDAVGVISLFHLMNRVANATGTPLDPMMVQLSPPVVAQFGANAYLSSNDTPS